MTYQRHDYALPPIDALDAALIAVGLLYEDLIPDEELTVPTRRPPIEMDFGRYSPRAPRFATIEHP